MPIRVAFRMVTPRTWTGGVNYLLNICRVLRTHDPDIVPVFFAPPDIGRDIVEMIVASTGAPPIPLRERTHKDDVLAIAGFAENESTEKFKSANIDVVFESTGYYGHRPPLPTISWIPDFQHRQLPHLFSYRSWLAREVRYRMILSNRAHVVLSSKDAHTDMIRHYGLSKVVVHVVPFAVLMENFPSFDEGERVRLAHKLPERFLFMPNQFWIHKNHKIVIEALGVLGKSAPLVVASGSGDHNSPSLMKVLQDRAEALGVSDKFRRLGHLSYQDVLALNGRADALLNPSLFEGWSTTVEEAKALGTPMVLSDLPVHREQAPKNAIFFDPHSVDACARSLSVAAAGPARRSKDLGAIRACNIASQKLFSARLRDAFLSALNGRLASGA